MAAADSCTIEAWMPRGLQRLVILFFMDWSTRQLDMAGIASHASGWWMSQRGVT
jgi:hypothetical protein